MGGVARIGEKKEMHTTFGRGGWEDPKVKDHLRDLGVDGSCRYRSGMVVRGLI